ncbi:PROTEIN S-ACYLTRANSFERASE 16-RELATED [Salix koriyanagi]|uniref:S-acyltransferase n=1 Tax=Salix koriyanagi TaxID=2511006 RepID=A0A9Q1AJ73_9ROSI|nr:PROTEIN S-ACYLTRANSFERASE 16-RELATED [Salix koriyanagi]
MEWKRFLSIPVFRAAVPLHQEPHNNSSQLRQCDKCCTYKPPRAHHCRICRRCVLRMDHHCLWINNCVGYWNYKAFVILVLYATIASIYSSVMIISCALQKNWNFSGRVPMKIFFAISGAMMLGLSITFGTLLGFHIYLISCNMTTIENYEGIRAAWLARKSGHSYRHPFNLSVYKNITSVLADIYFWVEAIQLNGNNASALWISLSRDPQSQTQGVGKFRTEYVGFLRCYCPWSITRKLESMQQQHKEFEEFSNDSHLNATAKVFHSSKLIFLNN